MSRLHDASEHLLWLLERHVAEVIDLLDLDPGELDEGELDGLLELGAW